MSVSGIEFVVTFVVEVFVKVDFEFAIESAVLFVVELEVELIDVFVFVKEMVGAGRPWLQLIERWRGLLMAAVSTIRGFRLSGPPFAVSRYAAANSGEIATRVTKFVASFHVP